MPQKGKEMTDWKKPAWYLTPQEFANIIVDSLEDNNYFKRDEKAHPVDIEAAFSTTATAVAHAIDAIGKKMHEEEGYAKMAMMQATSLKKNEPTITVTSSTATVPSTVSYGGDDDYFEQKYGKFTK